MNLYRIKTLYQSWHQPRKIINNRLSKALLLPMLLGFSQVTLAQHGGDLGGGDLGGGALVGGGFSSREQASLRSSLLWKRIVSTIFIVAVILYLPVGMCLVTDWYNYANDAYVHAFRAVSQHIAVLSLITFFGTYLIDFRDLNFFIVQGS